MPLPSMEKACPDCFGNLHYDGTDQHPTRRGYDVHVYRCIDCGPMVMITQIAEEAYLTRWDGPKYPIIGETNPC